MISGGLIDKRQNSVLWMLAELSIPLEVAMKIRVKRLPLTALRTFEAAARLGRFKDAAVELGVSPTTVSNQIRRLERDWSCRLFVRRPREVLLTDTGRSLGNVVRQAFASIARELENHAAASPKRVDLAVGPIFAARWLTPRLESFRQSLPLVELNVIGRPRITGPATMPAPIAVDWGDGDWPGLESAYLFSIRYAPVVSPRLARTLGGLSSPDDLVRFPVLHQHDRAEWSSWLELVGRPGLEFGSSTIISDANVVLQAAIEGQGVALAPFPFAQEELRAGRLLKPFAIELQPSRSYYLLTRPGARNRPEVARVADWLLAQTEQERHSRGGSARRNPGEEQSTCLSSRLSGSSPSSRPRGGSGSRRTPT